jgi:hypothetical protein
MELHFVREDESLHRIVLEYIDSGDWPEWPYRGAEQLDRLYQAQGISSIRRLISRFRLDPATVATEFDTLMSGKIISTKGKADDILRVE